MSLIDIVFSGLFLLVFVGLIALAYERQNGHIGGVEPEPTLIRQLEACGHQLATARQAVDVWRSVAAKQKAMIEELAKALENCESG